jgi:flagellar hook-associated protein 1 FlgK
MSDLLGLGLSAVTAYRTALSAIGDNVANAETPGYARRDVRLQEGVNIGSRSPLYREDLIFSGVEAASIGRAWDSYRAADSRYAASASGRADVRQQWLGAIETNLGDGPTAVGSRIGAFFNAGEALAATPSDRLGRTAMLSTLGDAAGSIRDTAQALARVSNGIAGATTQEIDALNSELKALAEVNTALRQAAPNQTTFASLQDERDRLLDSISARIDITATIGEKGTVTVSLGGVSGVTILNAQQRAEISSATATDGRIQLRMFWDGTTSPLPATGGRLAGLVDVAASTADKRAEVEAIAQQFVTDVNNWNAQGRTAAGVAGAPLLSMTAGAMSLAVATTDPAAIAAASADGTENGNLLSLSALRGPNGVENRWAALVAAQAQSLNSAAAEAAAAATRRDNSFAARDEVSGVDLDREAAELLRYQRAYDASARIIQVARETMQTILDVL